MSKDQNGFFHGASILAPAQVHRNLLLLLFASLLGLASFSASATELTLYALFQDKAIVMVDGQRRMLAVGATSPEGVTLISTDTVREEAEIQLGGKRQNLQLGVVMSAFEAVARDTILLYADSRGFFHAEGVINKTQVRFLVDTGASIVAMNSGLAQRLGINYKTGQPGVAKTASGHVRTYLVRLDSVRIGDIVLRNVEAGVIEGQQPDTPLLGMSFLNALEMRREGDRMELKKRY